MPSAGLNNDKQNGVTENEHRNAVWTFGRGIRLEIEKLIL